MAHDFANKRSVKKTTHKRKPGAESNARNNNSQSGHWSSFFTGLLSGLFISFIIYLAFIMPNTTPAQQIAQSPAAPIIESTPSDDNLIFYEYLVDAEVAIDVELVEIPDSTRQQVDVNSYRLQAGSFQSRQDAEGRRGQIILLSMNAEVVPTVIMGKTWYRVRVGPFSGRSSADSARDQLFLNNIDSIISLVQ